MTIYIEDVYWGV